MYIVVYSSGRGSLSLGPYTSLHVTRYHTYGLTYCQVKNIFIHLLYLWMNTGVNYFTTKEGKARKHHLTKKKKSKEKIAGDDRWKGRRTNLGGSKEISKMILLYGSKLRPTSHSLTSDHHRADQGVTGCGGGVVRRRFITEKENGGLTDLIL